MNAEQLNSARLARWSQNGDARLTLEAAAEWLDAIGFCPYLPAPALPAPSFLEAVVGRPAQIPSAGERSRAQDLLVRMVENSAAVPLKLGNSLGEQPDFVASPEALRYIFALLGDRNFKSGPSTVGNNKVMPLAQHCWQAIQEHGPLDISALQPILGRDITEAAIARALQELWIGLYVFPVPGRSGQSAKWELPSRQFPAQVAAGANTGQAESQSAMVSLYLHAVVAAAEEEVLAFLSPLAPQSKLREVIRGLGSMRQLDLIDIRGRAHLCLQGGLLPEMVAQLSEEQLGLASVAAAASSEPGGIEIERELPRTYGAADEPRKFVPKKFVPKKFVPKKFGSRESGPEKSAGKRWSARPSSERPGSGGARRFARPENTSSFRPRSFTGGSAGAPDAQRREGKKTGFDRPRSDSPRWRNSSESAGKRVGGDRPAERKSFPSLGFKGSGFKSGRPQPGGAGPAKPWAAKRSRSAGEDVKPWKKKTSAPAGDTNSGRSRDGEERPKRWQKPEGGGRAGFPNRFAGDKPKSLKKRTFRERSGTESGAEERTGGDKREAAGGKKFGDNRTPKPFWAKNPRGGKGSVAASRTNRPRGGKKGGKKK